MSRPKDRFWVATHLRACREQKGGKTCQGHHPPGGRGAERRQNVPGAPSFWRAGNGMAGQRSRVGDLYWICSLGLVQLARCFQVKRQMWKTSCEVWANGEGRRAFAFWLRNFACWRMALFAHWLGICLYLRREENCVHNRCLDGDLCGRGGAVAGCAVGHIPRGP